MVNKIYCIYGKLNISDFFRLIFRYFYSPININIIMSTTMVVFC